MEHTLEFKSAGDAAKTLIVEPWAEEFAMPAGTVIRLVVTSPSIDTPLIISEGEYLICYLWAGATARVLVNGEDVSGDSLQNPVPHV